MSDLEDGGVTKALARNNRLSVETESTSLTGWVQPESLRIALKAGRDSTRDISAHIRRASWTNDDDPSTAALELEAMATPISAFDHEPDLANHAPCIWHHAATCHGSLQTPK